jgi:hypothetical protein
LKLLIRNDQKVVRERDLKERDHIGNLTLAQGAERGAVSARAAGGPPRSEATAGVEQAGAVEDGEPPM